MHSEISIIVPIYNEAKIIENFINKLFNTFVDLKPKYIFIDDGSEDGSREWLEENLKSVLKKENYDLITLDKNKGKGYAVRQGILKIEGSHTIFIDSDLEYDPKDALNLYNQAKKNKDIKVIYGSRYISGKLQLRRHFFNDIAVRLNTWIFNLLFDQSITDLHTGTKIIKNDLLKSLQLSLNRFGLEIDISTQISKKNVNIYESGISYIERTVEEGKKITIIDGFLSYYFLFRARFLQNDLQTQTSLIYSLIMMTYIGSYFGMGIGKTMIIVVFALVGLLNAMHRKLIPLSIIFLSIFIGSLFSSGNGRIYPILLFYFLSLWISKKISNKYNNHNNYFLKFFI